MAEVVRPIGLATQIAVIAHLRWRVFRNSLRQSGAKLELLGLILSGLVGAVFVFGLAFGFGAGAYAFVASRQFGLPAVLLWGVFLYWQTFPIFFAGVTIQFDFRNLLRFPLTLRAFYLISLAYGLADPVAVAALVWLIAMGIGIALARAELLPAALVVLLAFALLSVALERLIGSWLARLLARRRSREIFFVVFILLMLSLQFSGVLLERWGRVLFPWIRHVQPVIEILPPGMAAQGLRAAVENNSAGFIRSAAGLFAYAALFGVLLWSRLAAQYGGEDLGESQAPLKTAAAIAPAPPAFELPGLLRPQIVALAEKEFRYLVRNGVMMLNLLLPPMLVFLFSYRMGAPVGPRGAGVTSTLSHEWAFPAAMGYMLLLVLAPAYNMFAYDGRGIQTLMCAPLQFRDVFLAKNLYLAVLIAFEGVLTGAVLVVRLGAPSPPTAVATLAALLFAALAQLVVANWTSISFPRRLQFGTLRNQRASGITVLITLGTQIVLFVSCWVIFLLARWLGSPWTPAAVFSILAAAAAGGYASSLDPLSRLAERKRDILAEKLCR